jgi:translocation and assembly module TamB
VTLFGPQAQLAVIGKPRSGSIYDLDTRFIADNIVIMAKGPFDVAKLTTGGMGASVVVKDLKKMTPAPAMGEGRATGTFSGNLGDLRFAGAAQAADLELLGYRLLRASGPVKVEWTKGALDVQGDLVGVGGSGQGLLAQAGGAGLRVKAQVARLKDGRVLIKSLDAIGDGGVRVRGTGGQNLLGQGLSFKGDVEISDLGKFAPGSTARTPAPTSPGFSPPRVGATRWPAARRRSTGCWAPRRILAWPPRCWATRSRSRGRWWRAPRSGPARKAIMPSRATWPSLWIGRPMGRSASVPWKSTARPRARVCSAVPCNSPRPN